MTDQQVPPTLPVRSDLPRKVVILFLLVIDTAIGIFLFFRWKPDIHFILRQVFADLCLGLAAGFGTRFLLRRRGWFVRSISAAAGLIIGLLVLGAMTGWTAGLGPLNFWRTTIDWAGMIQIAIGLISMTLAIQAWSKPSRLVVPVVTPPVPVTPVLVTPAPLPPDVHTRPHPKRKKAKRTQPSSALPGKPAAPRKRNTRIENRPLSGLSLRKPKVRLSKVEKHLCPYCLEPVARHDPRGIVECEICHTLHHADCWAIAGACQVPHYTA